jgi:hypothetical protein
VPAQQIALQGEASAPWLQPLHPSHQGRELAGLEFVLITSRLEKEQRQPASLCAGLRRTPEPFPAP